MHGLTSGKGIIIHHTYTHREHVTLSTYHYVNVHKVYTIHVGEYGLHCV
jgi:hypothetical protein